jgi:hypothetical protein
MLEMPIFMIGTQRSGSNLLRLMLNQLGEIAAPHPPHILERLMPLMDAYGDLSSDASFAQLVDDVCRLVEANPVPWDAVVLDREAVAADCRQRSLVAVYGAVHDRMAAVWGASDWVCKSLANVHFLPEISAHYPNARYVYLYRDGRDVAVSFRAAVVGEKHFHPIATQWHREQQLALNMPASIPSERCFRISYEQLTTDPEASLRALCAFLGAEYRDSMLAFNQSSEAERTARSGSMWSNVTRPVIHGNSRKFLQRASEDDIRIFESVAGASLDALAYERVLVRPGEEQIFDSETLAAFDSENRQLKEAVKTRLDPEELRLREPQQRLLAEIAARLRAIAC